MTSLEPFSLTATDVARLFGLRHATSVYRNPVLMAAGVKLGKRRWRWRASDLEQLVADLRGGPR